jgi:hypothetical protein
VVHSLTQVNQKLNNFFKQLCAYFTMYRSAALITVLYFRTTIVGHFTMLEYVALIAYHSHLTSSRVRHILITDRKFKSSLRLWGVLQWHSVCTKFHESWC